MNSTLERFLSFIPVALVLFGIGLMVFGIVSFVGVVIKQPAVKTPLPSGITKFVDTSNNVVCYVLSDDSPGGPFPQGISCVRY